MVETCGGMNAGWLGVRLKRFGEKVLKCTQGQWVREDMHEVELKKDSAQDKIGIVVLMGVPLAPPKGLTSRKHNGGGQRLWRFKYFRQLNNALQTGEKTHSRFRRQWPTTSVCSAKKTLTSTRLVNVIIRGQSRPHGTRCKMSLVQIERKTETYNDDAESCRWHSKLQMTQPVRITVTHYEKYVINEIKPCQLLYTQWQLPHLAKDGWRGRKDQDTDEVKIHTGRLLQWCDAHLKNFVDSFDGSANTQFPSPPTSQFKYTQRGNSKRKFKYKLKHSMCKSNPMSEDI